MADCRAYIVPPEGMAALRAVVDLNVGALYVLVDGNEVSCLYLGLTPELVDGLIQRGVLIPTVHHRSVVEAPPSRPRRASAPHLQIAS